MPENSETDDVARISNDDLQARIRELQARIAECEEAISRLKKAEEECDWIRAGEQAAGAGFEKNNLSLDLILESITDGFVAVDNDWRISRINEIACQILNRPRTKALGQPIWNELPPGIRETLHDPAHQAVSDQMPASLEAFFASRASWYEYRIFPSQEGLYIFFHDVTEEKKAREKQALLAAIVNYSDDAIMAVTMEGVITYWSPGAERMYGYPAAEVCGESIALIVPEELRHESQLFMELLQQVEREQDGVNFETVRVAKDGKKLNISVRFSLMKDQEGGNLGVSVVHRDITDRMKLEEVLGRLEKKQAS